MTPMWRGESGSGIRYRKGDINFSAPICQTTTGFFKSLAPQTWTIGLHMHLHTSREKVGSGRGLCIWIGVLFHNYSKCGYPYLMKTLSVHVPPVPLNTVLLTKSPFVMISLCELRFPPLQRYRAMLCTSDLCCAPWCTMGTYVFEK